jgi:hypothetical protein
MNLNRKCVQRSYYCLKHTCEDYESRCVPEWECSKLVYCIVPIKTKKFSGNGNSALSKSVFFYILEEDGVDSSEFSASRGTLQNIPGSHFSTRGKMCIPLSENSVVLTLSS